MKISYKSMSEQEYNKEEIIKNLKENLDLIGNFSEAILPFKEKIYDNEIDITIKVKGEIFWNISYEANGSEVIGGKYGNIYQNNEISKLIEDLFLRIKMVKTIQNSLPPV